MPAVLHLVDDPGLGGVNRVLDSQLPRLQGRVRHERRVVRSVGTLPGRVDADMVVVHFTASWAKLPYLMALRQRCGGPMVMVEHSYTAAYEAACVPDRRRFRAMLRLAFGLFDRIVAVSHGQAAWMREAGLAPGRLVAIPQSLDLAELERLPLPARRDGPVRLGAYGRLAPQKGFDRLITAMRAVSPERACLHLAGFGPEAARLQALAGGMPHVHVDVGVAAPSRFCAGVDAVVVPSRWEAYGLVAVEARAAGRPLLVSAVDGLPEQVCPDWGMTVDAADAAALARGLARLAGADCTALGKAARASVAGHYERHLEAWRDLVDTLLPAQGRRLAA